jgi:hypothetical protein
MTVSLDLTEWELEQLRRAVLDGFHRNQDFVRADCPINSPSAREDHPKWTALWQKIVDAQRALL